MSGLTVLDLIVIIVYFLITISISFWAMRRIKNREDYFLAGRKFKKIVQMFAAFGQTTSVAAAVNVTAATMQNGISGIWAAMMYLFGTPFYWFLCVWYRRLRLMTLGDFFEDRFGSRYMAGLFAIISAVCLTVSISLGFNALGKTVLVLVPKTVSQLTSNELVEYKKACELEKLETADYLALNDSERAKLNELRLAAPRKFFPSVSKETFIAIVCVITLIYATLGGLEAAFIMNLIDGVFLLVTSTLLLLFIWTKTNLLFGGGGGPNFFKTMRILHDYLPESYFQIFGSPQAVDFTWYYIAVATVMVFLSTSVLAQQLTTSAAAKDEYAARFGFVTGLYMKRMITVSWGAFTLAAVLLYGKSVQNPDMIYGAAVFDLLGPVKLGLVGLMIASLAAAIVSTASNQMLCASALLTQAFCKPFCPQFSEKNYIFIGRLISIVVIVVGATIAVFSESVFQQLKLVWEIPAIFAATFWCGMIWRKANGRAAWYSIIVTLLLFFAFPILIPAVLPDIKTNSYFTKTTDPLPVKRTYTAHKIDVENREKEIIKWDELNAKGQSSGPRPEHFEVGKKFTKVYKLPPKSVFWTQGVKLNNNGRLEGSGMLNIDLAVIDRLGFDLSGMSYAFNETLRAGLRVIVPFGIIILVSLFTKQDDRKILDRFFVKMKTKVLPDREADRKELEISYGSPSRFDYLKLFPNSDWEFTKWTRQDAVGFGLSIAAALAIFGSLFILVSVGK